MKKGILVLTVLIGLSLATNAQDKRFSLGIGIGGASASSKSDNTSGSGVGLNFYLNGMYNINSHISAGIEYNSNLAVIVNDDITDLNVSATVINGLLAKGKYAFGEGRTNPYVGIMAGLYTLAPGSITASGASGIGIVFEKKTSFGFAPEVGIELGSFQLATSYHFVGKYSLDFPNPIDGGTIIIDTNYTIWQFNIGWNIGLVKK